MYVCECFSLVYMRCGCACLVGIRYLCAHEYICSICAYVCTLMHAYIHHTHTHTHTHSNVFCTILQCAHSLPVYAYICMYCACIYPLWLCLRCFCANVYMCVHFSPNYVHTCMRMRTHTVRLCTHIHTHTHTQSHTYTDAFGTTLQFM